MTFIKHRPKPSHFIKSIAEQGYLLETALADLIDNSITAESTEINIFLDEYNNMPSIFIADDGRGMTNDKLLEALRMPSNSLESLRNPKDLGRFGLGLKTASFSQARKITIISYDYNQSKFNGYCWDILNLEEDWNLLPLNNSEIKHYIKVYENKKANSFINSSKRISTLIIWEQLFREHNIEYLRKYLNNEVQQHLSLVFHRFLSRSNFGITVGNIELKGFDPFPESMSKLQLLRIYHNDSFTVQGYTLPYSVLKSKSENSLGDFVMQGKNLSDMEGIYLYREDRLIYYGGWSRLQSRQQYLKLARLMINIENKHDGLFQINVAKSSMQIPKQYMPQIREVIRELAENTKNIYYQKQANILLNNEVHETRRILDKKINNKGVIFSVNKENDIYKRLIEALDTSVHQKLFHLYIDHVVNTLNKYVNYDSNGIEEVITEPQSSLSDEDLKKLKNIGLSEFDLKYYMK
jgi:hypothetical protein